MDEKKKKERKSAGKNHASTDFQRDPCSSIDYDVGFDLHTTGQNK